MSRFLTWAVEDARLEEGGRLLGAISCSSSSCSNLTFLSGAGLGSGSGSGSGSRPGGSWAELELGCVGVLVSDVLCSTEVEQRFKADSACVWFGDAKSYPPSQSFFASCAVFFSGAQGRC